MNRRDYLDRIASFGCMVCRKTAQIHHIVGGSAKAAGIRRGMSQKVRDEHVIPLCELHHTGNEGIHKIGVLTWEARYGTQVDMWIAIQTKMEGVKMEEKPRKLKTIAKMLPRRFA